MRIEYNVQGKRRKELANAISGIVGQEVNYKGIPSYEYVIGEYTVDKNGTLKAADGTDEEEIKKLVTELAATYGFSAESGQAPSQEEPAETETVEPEEVADMYTTEEHTLDTAESLPEAEPDKPAELEVKEAKDLGIHEGESICISLPGNMFTPEAINRFRAIVQSKQTLLKRALETDSLEIRVSDEEVSFPWFKNHGLEGEVDAYLKLVVALSKMAIVQRRVTAIEKEFPDEKQAMRLFLIRLNFIGDEFKTARAILMRNFIEEQKKDQPVAFILPEIKVNGVCVKKEESHAG